MTPEEKQTPEERLGAFFAEAEPAPRDLGFQAMVAEKIARRRAIATVVALVPWTIAAIALCWALGPLVEPYVIQFSQMLAPAVAILAVTAIGVWSLMTAEQRLAPA